MALTQVALQTLLPRNLVEPDERRVADRTESVVEYLRSVRHSEGLQGYLSMVVHCRGEGPL